MGPTHLDWLIARGWKQLSVVCYDIAVAGAYKEDPRSSLQGRSPPQAQQNQSETTGLLSKGVWLSRSSENTEKLPTILQNNVTCSWWWEECYCSESMRTFRCSQCVEQARKRHGCLSVASWLSVATMPPSEARPISGEQVLLGMHNTLLSKCRVAPFPFPTNWPIKAFLNLGKKSCKRNLYFTTVSFPQASQRLKRKRQYKAGQRLFTWKHTAWK